jgi:hypothetical protein
MSLTDQHHEPNPLDIFNVLASSLLPILPDLVLKAVNGPAEQLQDLRCDVELMIFDRLTALDLRMQGDDGPGWSHKPQVEAEVVRLRSIKGIVPFLGSDALTYILGQLRIDGRPGDYVTPPRRWPRCPSTCDCEPKPEPETDEQRMTSAVELALSAALCFPREVATLWVSRPAVEAVRMALREQYKRESEVTRQPDHAVVEGAPARGGDWAIRDLIVVQPPDTEPDAETEE